MGDPVWRSGFALLAGNDLSFDLQTAWWHFDEAADLARTYPQTQIIVNHTGLPADRSEEGIDAWGAAMRTLAREPNVAVKISGIGTPEAAWTTESNRRVVLETIDAFGIKRCMFASNYPVDSLVASFDTLFDGFLAITASFDENERRQLFHNNAIRFYRMPLDLA